MPETLSLSDVRQLSFDALCGAGASDMQAGPVADSIMDAEAEGIRNVGLAFLPFYCRHLVIGKVKGDVVPDVRRTAPGSLVADAKLGFCHTAYVAGEEQFHDMARTNGIAGFALTNSYTSGVIGWFPDRMAKAGLIGFTFTNASPAMAPFGGSKALFGTNPLAFGVPRKGKPPLVIDQSSTATAMVNVIKKMEAGEPIPDHWGLDGNGKPTTDPAIVLSEGTMAPSGGYKGAALALIVEIMAGGLGGANWSFEASSLVTDDGGPPTIGQFMLAIDPAKFANPHLADRLEVLFEAMLAQEGVRLPGDRRHGFRVTAEKFGVEVPDDILETIRAYI